MKRLSIILLCAAAGCAAACAGQPGTAAAGPVECGPYTVNEIADGVFHIQDYCAANPAGETFDSTGVLTHFNNCSDMYLVVGSERALLIDLSNRLSVEGAADSLRALVAARVGSLPLTITFTHNHGDHTGMIGAFMDEAAGGPEAPSAALDFALPRTDFEPLVSYFSGVQYSLYDQMTFCLGGDRTVESFLVPGHTSGSVVFFLRESGILFSGDAIGSGHGVWIFNSAAFAQYNAAVPALISFIQDPANGIDASTLKIYGGHYWQRDWLESGPLTASASAALAAAPSASLADGSSAALADAPSASAICKQGSGTLAPDEELGFQYILDMQALLDDMSRGEAYAEPSGLGRPGLDTYFRHGLAIITWSASQCSEYFAE